MASTEGALTSTDGTQLFTRHWVPDAGAKAVICLVHGLGEHSGRYDHVARTYNDAGYAVLAMDTRGHGRSPGTRGHTPFDATMEDVSALLARGAELHPGVPVFLYGHSLGGLIVLTFCLRNQPRIAGVVATSPGLASPLLEQKLKIGAAKVLGSLLPTVTIPTGLDANQISRDPAVVADYKADPLNHDKASLALGRDGALAAEAALAGAGRFALPLLVIHGTADEIAFASGTEAFAAQVPGDVTLTLYDGLTHECHNEPEKATVLADVVAWLDAHLA